MTNFDERKRGFEADFARDQDLTFRITARRNRLLGLWAAERLGIAAGEAADEYAKTVVAADFEKPGDDDVVEKVHGDLVAKGVDISASEIRAELGRAAILAREQLTGK
jgi:hypothetical protein